MKLYGFQTVELNRITLRATVFYSFNLSVVCKEPVYLRSGGTLKITE